MDWGLKQMKATYCEKVSLVEVEAVGSENRNRGSKRNCKLVGRLVFCISLFATFTFLQLAVTTSASDPQAFSLKVLTPQSQSKSKSSFPLTWNSYIGHRCTLLVTLWSTLEIPTQRSRTLWRGRLSPKKFSLAPYNKIILVLLTW